MTGSNFWIGGGGGWGGTVSDSILVGGGQDTFSYQLFIILNILGGHVPPGPPAPRFPHLQY